MPAVLPRAARPRQTRSARAGPEIWDAQRKNSTARPSGGKVRGRMMHCPKLHRPTMHRPAALLALLLCALPALAEAQAPAAPPPPAVSTAADRQQHFGAVAGPAMLPDGAMAFSAYVGLPELGAGVRSGQGPLEL